MFMFDYVIERKLPTGNWQKVTGTMTAKSVDEVEKTLTGRIPILLSE